MPKRLIMVLLFAVCTQAAALADFHAGDPVHFDGSVSKGNGLEYAWSFGDGGTAPGARVVHVYEKPGRYDVILEVRDRAGCESQARRTVEVL